MPPGDGEAGMEFDGIEIEWDEAKRHSNRAKHDVDFFGAAQIWHGAAWTRASSHASEERLMTIGPVGDRVLVVIWTWRNGKRRLISARAARRDERKDYARFLEGPGEMEGQRPH
jgi:uncharacterized DUF497 family protein